MTRVIFEKNAPIRINGIPNPKEYANNSVNAWLGVVVARVKMLPRIGPMHGVHPVANANPNTKDSGYLALPAFGNNFFSKFSFKILVDNIIKEPNPMIMIPPIWLMLEIRLVALPDRTLFSITPNMENMMENPRTKNIVFSKMFSLFTARLVAALFFCRSVIVVPEMYAKNAGITGKMHGAKNEPSPATAAIPIVMSANTKNL